MGISQRQFAALGLLGRRFAGLECYKGIMLPLRLYLAVVEPTASYASGVWGWRPMALLTRRQREAIVTRHITTLRRLCGVAPSVPASIILHELRLSPLAWSWRRQVVRLWNKIIALPAGNIYRIAAHDDLRAAEAGVRNWAAGLIACVGHVQSVVTGDTLTPFPIRGLNADDVVHRHHDNASLRDLDPRVAPSGRARSRTYHTWFAADHTDTSCTHDFWRLPLSDAQLMAITRFRLGCHGLPIVVGRLSRPPVPRHLRVCTMCSLGALGDEYHLLMECPLTASVRAAYPHIFRVGYPFPSLHAVMWSHNCLAVARFMLDCLSIAGLTRAVGLDCS